MILKNIFTDRVVNLWNQWRSQDFILGYEFYGIISDGHIAYMISIRKCPFEV